jgi:enoyl-CoA hydratase/carnithine racemase
MTSSTDAQVVLEVTPRAATITLNSPNTRNALSSKFLAELLLAIEHSGETNSRVIVLTHAPPVFCSGLDLKQVASGSIDLSGLAKVFLALRQVRQPTIAVLTGAARAGGLGIMAACDLVVVAPTVNFAFTEVKLGAVPAAISVPILARVTWSSVVAAFITGEEFSAARALSIGLVSHVSDDPHTTAQELVTSICAAGPEAVATTIKILRRAANDAYKTNLDEMRQLSEHVFESAEAREGIDAFLHKRPPSWRM